MWVAILVTELTESQSDWSFSAIVNPPRSSRYANIVGILCGITWRTLLESRSEDPNTSVCCIIIYYYIALIYMLRLFCLVCCMFFFFVIFGILCFSKYQHTHPHHQLHAGLGTGVSSQMSKSIEEETGWALLRPRQRWYVRPSVVENTTDGDIPVDDPLQHNSPRGSKQALRRN